MQIYFVQLCPSSQNTVPCWCFGCCHCWLDPYLTPCVKHKSHVHGLQQRDPCVAALTHPEAVAALAVSRTRIVAGAGEAVFVYDAGTEELLEELECTAKVSSVAVFEDETGAGWIAAGCEDGTIKVWDAGTPACPIPHLAQT